MAGQLWEASLRDSGVLLPHLPGCPERLVKAGLALRDNFFTARAGMQ